MARASRPIRERRARSPARPSRASESAADVAGLHEPSRDPVLDHVHDPAGPGGDGGQGAGRRLDEGDAERLEYRREGEDVGRAQVVLHALLPSREGDPRAEAALGDAATQLVLDRERLALARADQHQAQAGRPARRWRRRRRRASRAPCPAAGAPSRRPGRPPEGPARAGARASRRPSRAGSAPCPPRGAAARSARRGCRPPSISSRIARDIATKASASRSQRLRRAVAARASRPAGPPAQRLAPRPGLSAQLAVRLRLHHDGHAGRARRHEARQAQHARAANDERRRGPGPRAAPPAPPPAA